MRQSPAVRPRRAAAFLVLLLPVVLTAGLGVGAGYAVSRVIRIPKVSELASYTPDIVTEVRGSDGSVIARFAIERRVLIARDQIPDVMVKALLAMLRKHSGKATLWERLDSGEADKLAKTP